MRKDFTSAIAKVKGGKAGTWSVRTLIYGKYQKKSLGKADDYGEDNAVDVLSFGNAQKAARSWADSLAKKEAGVHGST